jgi:purine nucleosidase
LADPWVHLSSRFAGHGRVRPHNLKPDRRVESHPNPCPALLCRCGRRMLTGTRIPMRLSHFRLSRVFIAIGLAWPLVLLGAPRKVIIDQDAFGPGGSNLQAILLALQSPDVEVLGITIESGDGWCAENVAHALRFLELVGRTNIPVVPGAMHPLINSRLETERWEARYGRLVYKGAWTLDWPKEAAVLRTPYHEPEVVPPLREGASTLRPSGERAADFLVRKAREFPGQVTVIALGPVTNLGLAVRLDGEFARLVRELVLMGGSYNPQPADNPFALEYRYTPRLEFNFRWDPEAMRIVLRAPWPRVVQVPVDPTTKTFFTPELRRRCTQADTAVTRYLATYAEGYPMWDELAVAVWLDPTIVTRRETMAVDVDIDHGAGYGNTLSWAAGRGPGVGERDVEVVLDIDVARFEALCAATFNRPPSAE